MKAPIVIALTLVSATFTSMAEDQDALARTESGFPSIREIIIVDPIADSPLNFSKDDLMVAIRDWRRVEKQDFYYESAELPHGYLSLKGEFESSDDRSGL